MRREKREGRGEHARRDERREGRGEHVSERGGEKPQRKENTSARTPPLKVLPAPPKEEEEEGGGVGPDQYRSKAHHQSVSVGPQHDFDRTKESGHRGEEERHPDLQEGPGQTRWSTDCLSSDLIMQIRQSGGEMAFICHRCLLAPRLCGCVCAVC